MYRTLIALVAATGLTLAAASPAHASWIRGRVAAPAYGYTYASPGYTYYAPSYGYNTSYYAPSYGYNPGYYAPSYGYSTNYYPTYSYPSGSYYAPSYGYNTGYYPAFTPVRTLVGAGVNLGADVLGVGANILRTGADIIVP